jgi:hypothetical protein
VNNAPLEAALHYAELGYRVFPCVPGGKMPATPHGCLDATSDTDTISRWWAENPARNVAISTDGLCVVDVDVMEDGSANPWLEAVSDSIEPGATSITPSRGLHWWFRQDGVPLRNTASRIKKRVDTRATGGYVVVPPSRTENGGYSWSEDIPLPPADSLPVIPEWIERQLVGDDGLFDGKQQSKAESKQQSKAPIGEVVASHAADDGDTIPEGMRNHTLTSLGGTLRRQGFSQSAIEAALLATNQERCKPPMPTDEVRQVARSVSRYEPDQIAKAVAEDTATAVFTDGTGSAVADGTDKNKHRAQTAAERFPLFDGAALDAMDTAIEFLVNDVMVLGQPAIIAGGEKMCKTTMAVDLGVSLASGRPFLGEFVVPATRRVLLLSGESGAATLQETARRIAKSKGVFLRLLDDLHMCFAVPQLGDPMDLKRIGEVITDNKIEVVMIDPVYLAMAGLEDAGNLFSVGAKLAPLTELGQATGSTMILIHHTKKSTNEPFAMPELGDISWAGFKQWARQWLLLNRRSRYDPEQAGRHELWMTTGGSAHDGGAWAVDIEEGSRKDPTGRQWNVVVGSAREERESRKDGFVEAKLDREERKRLAKLEVNAQRILEAVQRFPQGETVKAIRDAAGMSATAAGPAVAILEERGEIEPVEIIKSGKDYAGYRLASGLTGTAGTAGTEAGLSQSCPSPSPPGPGPGQKGGMGEK